MPAKPEEPGADQAGKSTQPAPTAAVPFETSLLELNDIVHRLESGALGLSESIIAYERGVTILRHLHEQLADVEERVRLLVRIDEQGRPVLEAAGKQTSSAEKPSRSAARDSEGSATDGDSNGRRGTRAASRIGRPKRLPGMDDSVEDV